MRLGPLFIGWVPLSESERIALGLPMGATGWRLFCIEWGGRGVSLIAAPR